MNDLNVNYKLQQIIYFVSLLIPQAEQQWRKYLNYSYAKKNCTYYYYYYYYNCYYYYYY